MGGSNPALRALRKGQPSRVNPGEPLGRQELAELVNAHVEASTNRPGALDANYIGKLERGVISWPGRHYRAGLREVLGVGTDRELGLTRSRHSEPVGGTVDVPPETNEPLARLTRLPASVSREHVEAVRATARLFTDTDQQHGGVDVARAAGICLGHTMGLLDLPCPPAVRPELFSAVGWLGHVVGFAAFDATKFDQASSALSFALSCAEQAGDWHLRAKVLSSMARAAIWRGDADAGLTWVELALVRADRLTPTERAMLLTGRARALALLGRVQDTVRTIRAADEHFRRADPDKDPQWMAYYDLAQHLGDTGHALFDLAVHGHHLEEASRRLAAAVAGHRALYARAKAFSGMKLATLTLMTSGDPCEGAAIGQQALADLGQVHSTRALQVLTALDGAAVPHSRINEVAQLRQGIAEVVHAS